MKFDVAGKYDVIVIGSGISGLICALELAKKGRTVCVLAKEAVTEGSSLYAQGGIAVPLSEADSVEKHLQDTIKAGSGLTNINTAKEIISHSVSSLESLISYGIKFDADSQNKIHLTKEAAHSTSRVCHAGGDASGRYITKVLVDKACRESNISISQGTSALALLTNDRGSAIGVLIQDVTKNHYSLLANDIVLASGGIGQIFENTTNPKVCTCDGIVMAYQAGAELQDVEMIQFHPTVLLDNGDPFLISEAIRGEGGKLKNINGEYFANHYHEQGELAPRDVLSRAIFFELEKTNSNRVFLNISNFTEDYFKLRFPSIYQTCLDRKIELFRTGIPVSPAVHYFIGGIKCDLYGATSIEHLWCIGECASNGFHGANRLASNSLLECIVTPHFLANKLLEDFKSNSSNMNYFEIDLDLKEYDDSTISQIMYDLKKKNSNSLGLIRRKSVLSEHLNYLNSLLELLRTDKLSLNCQVQELKNMALLSFLICQAAIKREHSLGVHYREDFLSPPSEFKHSVFCKNTELSWLPQVSLSPAISNFR